MTDDEKYHAIMDRAYRLAMGSDCMTAAERDIDSRRVEALVSLARELRIGRDERPKNNLRASERSKPEKKKGIADYRLPAYED